MNNPELSREQRERIKAAIDARKRDEFSKHRARLEKAKTSARRRKSWHRYYWNHRDEILARRAERKKAA